MRNVSGIRSNDRDTTSAQLETSTSRARLSSLHELHALAKADKILSLLGLVAKKEHRAIALRESNLHFQMHQSLLGYVQASGKSGKDYGRLRARGGRSFENRTQAKNLLQTTLSKFHYTVQFVGIIFILMLLDLSSLSC